MKGKKFLAFSLTVAMLAGGALSVSAAGVSDVFSADYYASKYGDLQAVFGNDAAALLQHFVTSGAKEGRVMSPILDVAAYRNAYADLDAAFGDDWDAYVDHYLTYGIQEKRTAGVLFDLADYAAKNADVKAAYGDDYAAIAQHYVNFGIKEGRPGGTIAPAAPAASSSSSNSNSGSSNNNSGSGTTTTPPPADTTTVVTHEHVWKLSYEKEGTCTEDGYKEYYCDTYKMYQIKDKDGNLIATKPVIVNGEKIRCDETKREVTGKQHVAATDANGNKVNYYLQPATCLATGIEKYTCARCGAHIDQVVPKLEHVYEAVQVVEPHGCTLDLAGYTVEKCLAGCNQTRKVNYTYLDHQVATYDLDKKAATCTSVGEAWGYCSVCDTKVKQTIPVKDHDYTKADGTDNNVTVYVDSYTVDKNKPCHNVVVLKVCRYCSTIDSIVSNTYAECKDEEKDAEGKVVGNGYCDDCLRSMTRNHTNQVMQYIPGDILDDKKGQ